MVDLILTVVEIVAPVFLLGAVGLVWIRAGLDYPLAFVTRLAMTLSVPCLIFTSLMDTQIAPAALRDISAAAGLAYLGVGVVVVLFVWAAGLDWRTYPAPLIFGNTGNLGLPLALFAFGEAGLDYAVVVFAVMAVLSFTIGVWLVSGGGSLRPVVREPIVLATLLGAAFLWYDLRTPEALTNALELIGQMAIPLMLITLGVAVARLRPGRVWLALALSVLKAALCAGLAWAVALWFELQAEPAAVLILQVATPVAVTNYMLAEKYGADADAVAGLVVVSTCLSVLTLPALLAVLL